ncbi:hypothetical protein, partial [Granulicatella balaenopterae]|uniref:hypothetical protein n=1 Tax=Granulicatella balaenopterae TaxID=137733 RepID=UPI001C434C58
LISSVIIIFTKNTSLYFWFSHLLVYQIGVLFFTYLVTYVLYPYINKKNSINYAPNHYNDVLSQHLNKKYNDDEIRQISMKNIESLAQIGDYDEY